MPDGNSMLNRPPKNPPAQIAKKSCSGSCAKKDVQSTKVGRYSANIVSSFIRQSVIELIARFITWLVIKDLNRRRVGKNCSRQEKQQPHDRAFFDGLRLYGE